MIYSNNIVDLIKKTALQLIKEAAPPRAARREDKKSSEEPRAKDDALDPTAPIAVPDKKTVTSPENKPVNTLAKGISKNYSNMSLKRKQERINAVKEMQTAMQNLAQAVMVDVESNAMSLKPHDVIYTPANLDVKSSKKSFNDFIAEQYLGSLEEDKKGVEWSQDTGVVTLPGKRKTQTDIYELDVVMDTMRRLGTNIKEFKADGNWDFRTDNALKNIMGFAYSLLQLEGDFGLTNDIYSFADWQDFYKIMSEHKNNIDKANVLTNHLKTITKLYNHFRQQVLAKPEFRPTIEGKRSFEKYDVRGTNKNILTESEEQMASSDAINIPIVIDAPKLPGKKLNTIPLKILRNKNDYIKWMTEYAGNSTETAIDIFNKIIKPKIESM